MENPFAKAGGGALGKNAVIAVVHLKGTARDVSRRDLWQLEEATEPAREAGMAVRFGGLISLILNQPKAGLDAGTGVRPLPRRG